MRLELFHGTIKRFAEDITNNGIDIHKSREKLDFGKGFYLTNIKYFAERWAIDMAKFHSRRGRNRKPSKEIPTILTFTADTEGLDLNIVTFKGANDEWAKEIYYQRVKGLDRSDVDIIIGPIVDSGIREAINKVESGEYTMSMFINRIKRMDKIDIQYVFKTEKAISALRLEKVEEV